MLYKVVFAASATVGLVFADEKKNISSYDSWDEDSAADSWDDPLDFFDQAGMCGAGQCAPQPQCGTDQCGAGQCGVPPRGVPHDTEAPTDHEDDFDSFADLPEDLKTIDLGNECGAMCQASKMANNAFGAVGDALGFGGSNNEL